MVFKKSGLSLVFLFLILSPLTQAISTAPPFFETSYTPGSYQEFQSQVWDVEELNISFNGFLVERGEILAVSKGEKGVYTVKWGFKMPEELAPGIYDPLIIFKETPLPRLYGQTGISALAAIGVPVKFFVPYPEKYLSLTKFEWDQEVRKGGLLFFKARLKSLGNKTIEKVEGTAKIFGQGQEYQAPFTSAENIHLGETVELLGEWAPPAELAFGKYNLVGEITYDGINLTTLAYYFTYGDKAIEILSLSPLEIKTGEISILKLEVKSFWNEDLSFSVKVKAYDANNSLVEETVSAQTLVGRLSQAAALIYLDATAWLEGTYRLDISLDYEGEPSSKTFLLKVVSPPLPKEIEKPSALNPLLVALVIILALIIIGYGLWRYFSKPKG